MNNNISSKVEFLNYVIVSVVDFSFSKVSGFCAVYHIILPIMVSHTILILMNPV